MNVKEDATICIVGKSPSISGKKMGELIDSHDIVARVNINPNSGNIYSHSSKKFHGKYSKEDYIELLGMMYAVFKLAKTKGMLAIESHIERPEESALFQAFPKFSADHHALEFFCDYLRMMTLGTENAHELADLLDEELETHHAEDAQIVTAYQTMGDGFPALGIVAAVLGIIKTMSSITEPPEVLGKLIGGALVGTFLGIFLAYGIVSPLAVNMNNVFEADGKYLACIKAGLLAHVAGYAPAVSIEFARKTLLSKDRPSFFELEEAVAALPPV